MTSQQFNTVIHNSISIAFQEGVGKGRMTALDVAGILATHTANTLLVINEAQAKLIEAQKTAKEIVVPFDFKSRNGNLPTEDGK